VEESALNGGNGSERTNGHEDQHIHKFHRIKLREGMRSYDPHAEIT
jgi:hypothetical protein